MAAAAAAAAGFGEKVRMEERRSVREIEIWGAVMEEIGGPLAVLRCCDCKFATCKWEERSGKRIVPQGHD
jgi:hypothetical protein